MMNGWNEHPEEGLWTDYLDGTLGADERERLEHHLESCDGCRETVTALADLIPELGALPESGHPERDLWPEISARIAGMPAPGVVDLAAHRESGGAGRDRGERRIAFTLPQLAAAGIAMALLGGASAWGLLELGPGAEVLGPPYRIPSSSVRPASMDMRSLRPTILESEEAATDLKEMLDEGRDLLDPATVREIEGSLAQIEGAIDEVREALERDPASEELYQRLASNLRRRLHLLRSATAAIQAVS